MHNNNKSIIYKYRMQAQRLNFLLKEIISDPNEPFNYYGAAIEYLENDKKQAIIYFEILLKKFPDYLPTYYHAANLFFEINEIQKAKTTYQNGIALAIKLKKEKPRKELEAAYALFLDDLE
jgi:tetratricopeptide (TPR) repeat protein